MSKEPLHVRHTKLLHLSFDLAGTAIESLIRTLGEFKNEKLINIKKDYRIEIIYPKKLERKLG